jgi:hypothetical protein
MLNGILSLREREREREYLKKKKFSEAFSPIGKLL